MIIGRLSFCKKKKNRLNLILNAGKWAVGASGFSRVRHYEGGYFHKKKKKNVEFFYSNNNNRAILFSWVRYASIRYQCIKMHYIDATSVQRTMYTEILSHCFWSYRGLKKTIKFNSISRSQVPTCGYDRFTVNCIHFETIIDRAFCVVPL